MSATKPSERLVSLDAFRGATIALMVLVNNSGDGTTTYAPLKHAAWHGWTPTDVVFPSFLWIVGVAITLSLGKRLEAGASKARLMLQVARRAAILFGLGLLCYAFPHFDLSTQRILGVLQRIAICYLIASAIYLVTRVRGQILWAGGLIAAYWGLMLVGGSGGWDMEGNFAHVVDRAVLGAHNYAHAKTWDPEGLVSTLPAISTALLGILAGQILKRKTELSERTTWLFLTGNLLIVAGLILDCWMPINKKLWTGSFTLFMAGLDFVMLAISLWLVDGRGYKRAARPAVIFGMNAIAIYMASEALSILLDTVKVGARTLHAVIYQDVCLAVASPYNASLLFAVLFVLSMYGVAWGMHRRGWYLKV
jgi:predicted acyltransferase